MADVPGSSRAFGAARLVIKRRGCFAVCLKTPMMTSLGPHYHGAAYPRPDVRNLYGLLIGQASRTASHVTRPSLVAMRRLYRHTGEALDGLLSGWADNCSIEPLALGEVEDWKDFIDNAKSWTTGQKKKIYDLFLKWCPFLFELQCDAESALLKRMWYRILAFCKREGYPEYKSFRGINGRDDLAKVMIGPPIRAAENVIYASWGGHVKHMTFAERIAKLRSRHSQFKYHYSFDGSAFESSFFRELLAPTEALVYERLFGRDLATFIFHVCYSENVADSQAFELVWQARRASGDMQTAFGNWLVNILVQTCILKELGVEDYVIDVEGDDCIVSLNVPIFPSKELYAQYGFIAKVVVDDDLSKHSFCGAVFGPEGDGLTDVRKVILNFGWTDSKYRDHPRLTKDKLLVTKALSYGYQYPNCPVVRNMVEWIFRVLPGVAPDIDLLLTRGHPHRSFYPEFSIADFRRRHPLRDTHHNLESLRNSFGLDPDHLRLMMWYFDNKQGLSPYHFDFMQVEPDWVRYWNDNASDARELEDMSEHPSEEEIQAFFDKAGAEPGVYRVTNWSTLSYVVEEPPAEITVKPYDGTTSHMYYYGACRYRDQPDEHYHLILEHIKASVLG